MLQYRQNKGIIAFAITLAIIPFFAFIYQESNDLHGPVYSIAGSHNIAVELIDEFRYSGIYFSKAPITCRHFLQSIDQDIVINGDDFKLKNGMSIKLIEKDGMTGIFLDKMSAEKRIVLGLPLDINLANFNDLLLIPGLGESTVEKIITRRRQVGRFENLEQLTEINGIKEKRLKNLSKYLFVEK